MIGTLIYLEGNSRKCPSSILIPFEYIVKDRKILNPYFFNCCLNVGVETTL